MIHYVKLAKVLGPRSWGKLSKLVDAPLCVLKSGAYPLSMTWEQNPFVAVLRNFVCVIAEYFFLNCCNSKCYCCIHLQYFMIIYLRPMCMHTCTNINLVYSELI